MSETNHKRRRRSAGIQTEALETRSLLTAGAGNNFAILQASVDKANVPATIPFTITPQLFTRPNGHILVGIDVAQKSSSSVKPFIFKITDDKGHAIPFSRGTYNPNIQRAHLINGNATTAVTVDLKVPKTALSASQTYQVHIQGQDNTTGAMLVGFYLPGDANGNGVVDQSSLKTIRAALGSVAGSTKYNFAADMNRDGLINMTDLRLAQRNMGAKSTVSPVISANLDSSSDTGLQDRITKASEVKFTGQTTPNAVVTYQNINGKDPSIVTTADPTGNYTLTTPLDTGSNTFKVTTKDAFGQTITGQIAPVTRSDNAPPAVG